MRALGGRMTYIAQQRQTVDKPHKEVEQNKKTKKKMAAQLGGTLLNSEWKLMAAAGEILMHFLCDAAARCGI